MKFRCRGFAKPDPAWILQPLGSAAGPVLGYSPWLWLCWWLLVSPEFPLCFCSEFLHQAANIQAAWGAQPSSDCWIAGTKACSWKKEELHSQKGQKQEYFMFCTVKESSIHFLEELDLFWAMDKSGLGREGVSGTEQLYLKYQNRQI